MTSVRTTKKPLTGWVSPEIYQQVLQLCSGDNSPYKSISEYVTSLVNRDLAVREHKAAVPEQIAPEYETTPECCAAETPVPYLTTAEFSTMLMASLNNPDVVAKLKETLKTEK